MFIGASIASYNSFSWTQNALSDLGVVHGATASLFNFGLFLSGVLALNFTIGLFVLFRRSQTGKVGTSLLVLACVALEGISFFPENLRPYHYAFSVAFFVLMPIALLVFTGYFARNHQMGVAAFTMLIALVAAVPWVVQFTLSYVSGVAIPEAISATAGCIWVLFVSYKMLKIAVQNKRS